MAVCTGLINGYKIRGDTEVDHPDDPMLILITLIALNVITLTSIHMISVLLIVVVLVLVVFYFIGNTPCACVLR